MIDRCFILPLGTSACRPQTSYGMKDITFEERYRQRNFVRQELKDFVVDAFLQQRVSVPGKHIG